MIGFTRRLVLAIVITAVLVFGGLLVIDSAYRDANAGYHNHPVYHDKTDPASGYEVHSTIEYVYKW